MEHHLRAEPETRRTAVTFLTLIQVGRATGSDFGAASCEPVDGGWRVRAGATDVLVREASRGAVSTEGWTCDAPVGVRLHDEAGAEVVRFTAPVE